MRRALVLAAVAATAGCGGSGELAGFPGAQIKLVGVKSTPTFTADHLSVMKTSRGAKVEIWKPADELIDSVR